MDNWNIIETLISIATIIITAIIAIIAIRRSAQASRATITHSEMLSTLVGSVKIYRAILILIGNVSRGVIHLNTRENSEETAFDRYKRLIDDYRDKYEEIGSRVQLFFPEQMFRQHQLLLRLFNEARTVIYDSEINPFSNLDYSQIRAKVDTINAAYFKYLEIARHYLGTDSLEPIGADVAFTEELYGSQSTEDKGKTA